jgi:hypothetical protein
VWFLAIKRSKRKQVETWHERQERQFIEAIKKLKNFHVTDQGGVSIDPEELREKVIQSREQLKDLVAPAHRRQPVVAEQPPPV